MWRDFFFYRRNLRLKSGFTRWDGEGSGKISCKTFAPNDEKTLKSFYGLVFIISPIIHGIIAFVSFITVYFLRIFERQKCPTPTHKWEQQLSSASNLIRSVVNLCFIYLAHMVLVSSWISCKLFFFFSFLLVASSKNRWAKQINSFKCSINLLIVKVKEQCCKYAAHRTPNKWNKNLILKAKSWRTLLLGKWKAMWSTDWGSVLRNSIIRCNFTFHFAFHWTSNEQRLWAFRECWK